MTDRYAVLRGATVVNVIICGAGFAASLGAVPCPEGRVGDLYANGIFSTPTSAFDPVAHWASIQSIRNTKTQQGGFPVAGKWFHSDTFSRTQQIGLTMMGANIPAGLQWKTLDGTFVTMTPTLAGQIFASAAQQDAAIFAHAEALKAQGFDANINVGWPVTYGGV